MLPSSSRSYNQWCPARVRRSGILFCARDHAAKPHTLKDIVRGAVTALWLWKTGQSPFEGPHADWDALLSEFSGEGIWTRDVTLKQRSIFISELARYLVSEQAKPQPVGLGPQVFDAAGTRTPTPPALAGESDAASATNRSTQDVVVEPNSQPAVIQSDVTAKLAGGHSRFVSAPCFAAYTHLHPD